MVTYGNFILSLRRHIEEKTGITTVWRYPNYNAPEENFIGLEFVNTTYNNPTKLKELINQNIYLNIALFTSDILSQIKINDVLTKILLYDRIKLFDVSGETVIGYFSISRINASTNINDGNDVSNVNHLIRTYTDIVVELDHIKL